MRASGKNHGRDRLLLSESLVRRAILALFAILVLTAPGASWAQAVPADTVPFTVTAGTEVALQGWYYVPSPPGCTPQPAGTITSPVPPKYGS